MKAPCFKKAHETAKSGRWNQFNDKHLMLKPDRTIMSLPMVNMGIRKKWWSFGTSPLFGVHATNCAHIDDGGPQLDSGEAAALAPPVAGASAGASASGACGSTDVPAAPKGVKNSNAELSKVRLRHNNTVDFSAHTLLNSKKMRSLDAVVYIEAPLVEQFKFGLAGKTYEEQLEFWEGLALCGWSVAVGRAWMCLSSQTFAEDCGLSLTTGVNEATKLEDDAVVQVAYDAALYQTFLFETWL